MALYRFLFAPVLLAVAVAAGDVGEGPATAAPPAAVREAKVAVPPAPAAQLEAAPASSGPDGAR
jgi:hypothetical protein